MPPKRAANEIQAETQACRAVTHVTHRTFNWVTKNNGLTSEASGVTGSRRGAVHPDDHLLQSKKLLGRFRRTNERGELLQHSTLDGALPFRKLL